jgi:hypothetical protein
MRRCATHRLGQDGACGPNHPFPIRGWESRRVRASTHPTHQFAVAEARSNDTPGPMVEDSETFFK